MLEAADTPALRFLLEHGRYRRAASTFPSLTPVCLASIATGGAPRRARDPASRLVEPRRAAARRVRLLVRARCARPGSRRGCGTRVVNLNERHLSRSAETVYEALEGAGLTTAAINITTYRGRHRHLSLDPGLPAGARAEAVLLLQPLRVRQDRRADRLAGNRALGSIDAYAATVGRWLVTRGGFDLLVFYLPDYDYASHALGPDAAHEALAPRGRGDRGALRRGGRAGRVPRPLRGRPLLRPRADARRARRRSSTVDGALVTASNRAAMVYGDDPRRARGGARRRAVGRRRALPRGRRGGRAPRRRGGPRAARRVSRRPRARRGGAAQPERRRGARLGRAGLGVRRPRRAPPRGGGSHGSLAATDSEVPMLTRRPRRAARVDHGDQGARARALRGRRVAGR